MKLNPKKHKSARRKRGNISYKGEFIQERFWTDGHTYYPITSISKEEAAERKLIFRKATIIKPAV